MIVTDLLQSLFHFIFKISGNAPKGFSANGNRPFREDKSVPSLFSCISVRKCFSYSQTPSTFALFYRNTFKICLYTLPAGRNKKEKARKTAFSALPFFLYTFHPVPACAVPALKSAPCPSSPGFLFRFLATTTSRPFSCEYSQVESISI